MKPRLCGECGRAATFLVEPAGRYDFSGWAEMPACPDHLADVLTGYVDEVERVQVRYVDTPQSRPLEDCCNEGCDGLVNDGFGVCLRCEQNLFGPAA